MTVTSRSTPATIVTDTGGASEYPLDGALVSTSVYMPASSSGNSILPSFWLESIASHRDAIVALPWRSEKHELPSASPSGSSLRTVSVELCGKGSIRISYEFAAPGSTATSLGDASLKPVGVVLMASA